MIFVPQRCSISLLPLVLSLLSVSAYCHPALGASHPPPPLADSDIVLLDKFIVLSNLFLRCVRTVFELLSFFLAMCQLPKCAFAATPFLNYVSRTIYAYGAVRKICTCFFSCILFWFPSTFSELFLWARGSLVMVAFLFMVQFFFGALRVCFVFLVLLLNLHYRHMAQLLRKRGLG